MQTIAVLLTVFNRKDKTIHCLSNLFQQNGIDERFQLDVFLTNDGCTDGTPEAVREQFPQVNIVEGDGNLFWNRGMHKAWTAAETQKDYDFYLWLNDDTFIYNDCIEQLICASAACNERSVIVGATCAVGNCDKITYGGRKSISGELLKPNGKLQEAVLLNGNILLVPRYVFNILGKNDPFFHHGNGDSEYGYRADSKGLKSYVAPKILGECDAHPKMDGWCDPNKTLKERWRAFNKPTAQKPLENFYFERKYFGYKKAIFHLFTLYLRLLCPWIWTILK